MSLSRYQLRSALEDQTKDIEQNLENEIHSIKLQLAMTRDLIADFRKEVRTKDELL